MEFYLGIFNMQENLYEHCIFLKEEDTFSIWLEYFFKGYSQRDLQNLKTYIKNNIKNKKDAIDAKRRIEDLIVKIRTKGEDVISLSVASSLIGIIPFSFGRTFLRDAIHFKNAPKLIKQLRQIKTLIEKKMRFLRS
jgi:hypothetical protein